MRERAQCDLFVVRHKKKANSGWKFWFEKAPRRQEEDDEVAGDGVRAGGASVPKQEDARAEKEEEEKERGRRERKKEKIEYHPFPARRFR